MFKVVGQALDEVVRTVPVPTVHEAEMGSVIQTQSLEGMIAESLLSSMQFIFLVAKTNGKLVDRPGKEYPYGTYKGA